MRELTGIRADGGIRTHTGQSLKLLTLPLVYVGAGVAREIRTRTVEFLKFSSPTVGLERHGGVLRVYT